MRISILCMSCAIGAAFAASRPVVSVGSYCTGCTQGARSSVVFDHVGEYPKMFNFTTTAAIDAYMNGKSPVK